MSADKLEEINVDDTVKPSPMYISANLNQEYRSKLIDLLKEFKECFAWDYTKMPELDRSIVELRLPIKLGYHPYKQPLRRIFKEEVLADV
jgi:hypothetical protein